MYSIVRGSFSKETYHFKEPTNRSHPIVMYVGVNTHVHISKKIIYTLSIHEYIESSSLHYVYNMGWLRLVGSLQLQVSFANETYKRDDILQQRPTILRSLLIVATP